MQVKASLIVVLTRGGSTARLVAKYKPSIPVLTVAVPVLTTDSLTWTCSGEQPARQCLITRGLLPLLAEGSARATDTDTTDEIISVLLAVLHPASHARPGLGTADKQHAVGEKIVSVRVRLLSLCGFSTLASHAEAQLSGIAPKLHSGKVQWTRLTHVNNLPRVSRN